MDFPIFDYMTFAKTSSAGARIALTMSGLGPPPVEWMGSPADLVDLRDAGGTGTAFLREKIAHRYQVAPDQVLLTPGASLAIHIISAVVSIPGARAIIEKPVYQPLFMEPKMFGSVIGYIDRRVEDGFRLDPARAAASLELAPRASMIFFTNLHNPTGVLTSENDILQIGEAAAKTGTRLICCDLYADFLGSARPRSVANLVPGAVAIGSMTKAFGLGSIRVGWIICKDRDVMRRCEQYFDHLSVNCAMPSLRIASAAFDCMEQLEQRAREISSAGFAAYQEWADAETARKRIKSVAPAGGIIAFPLLYRVPDTMEFARRVRERHGVQVTPGEFFGAPGHLRIGFGLDPQKVRDGLAAVSAELS